MYLLHREQLLHTTLDEAWQFLKTPANLNDITPPDLHFEIVSDIPDEMYAGLLIEYRITIPFLGRRLWLTEIKHIREHHSFVDEQRLGPYRFWYHLHRITAEGNMVRSCDTVYYLPPYGIAGHLLHRLFIRKTLDRIFDHRRERLQQIFPSKP